MLRRRCRRWPLRSVRPTCHRAAPRHGARTSAPGLSAGITSLSTRLLVTPACSADRQPCHRLSVSAEHLITICGKGSRRPQASPKVYGAGICAPALPRRAARPAPGSTTWPSSWAVPTGAPRPKSMTAMPARVLPIAARTDRTHECVQPARSDAHASTGSRT
jgi:hypothetical protein